MCRVFYDDGVILIYPYAIGWGYPVEKNDQEIWFSIFYVLMGASAVAAALGYFAQAMILKDKNWFEVFIADTLLINCL
jgi:hypothetical protein